MNVSTETLFERSHTVECIKWTVSKRYDRLADRMALQEGNMHAKKIISRDETLSLWTDFIPWNLQ